MALASACAVLAAAAAAFAVALAWALVSFAASAAALAAALASAFACALACFSSRRLCMAPFIALQLFGAALPEGAAQRRFRVRPAGRCKAPRRHRGRAGVGSGPTLAHGYTGDAKARA